MKSIYVLIIAVTLALLVGFGFGYSSRSTESKETNQYLSELENMQKKAEFSGQFEAKKVDFEQVTLPELENGVIYYSEKNELYPLYIDYWIGCGWENNITGEVHDLIKIFPVSATLYVKDKTLQSSTYQPLYSKIRIFQDMDLIKSIVNKLESPGIYYNPADYESWKQDRKNLIREDKLSKDKKNILNQLADRENLLILDYGYKRVAVSYITQEVYDKASEKTDIDVISYKGRSNELYDLLNNSKYGKSPRVLWTRKAPEGMPKYHFNE